MNTFVKIPVDMMSTSRKKLVYGVGINDSDYKTQPKINGVTVKCAIYDKWKSMIQRCYSEKFQEKHKTYIGCSVCDEWLLFSNYAKWYNLNFINGYDLDKDIKIKGNKVYSPSSCLFVPRSVNRLLTDSLSSRGEYPIGVSLHKATGKFKAQISINGAPKHIGLFKTPELAHAAYRKLKSIEVEKAMIEFPSLSNYLEKYK